jgi:hypothetical protein
MILSQKSTYVIRKCFRPKCHSSQKVKILGKGSACVALWLQRRNFPLLTTENSNKAWSIELSLTLSHCSISSVYTITQVLEVLPNWNVGRLVRSFVRTACVSLILYIFIFTKLLFDAPSNYLLAMDCYGFFAGNRVFILLSSLTFFAFRLVFVASHYL